MKKQKHKHGESKTRLFKIWDNMIQRCTNKNYQRYKDYGGRGIEVCKEWKEYTTFRDWAKSHGYSDSLTIDRIDNSKGYNPENCRWVSYREQNNNQRTNYLITYQGDTRTLAEWSRELKICYETLKGRLRKHHWSVERAFSTPVRKGATNELHKFMGN